MDRRSRKRFDLEAPVKYSWTDSEQVQRAGQGTTRDVSERGIFILTDAPPPAGATVQVEVSFPFRDESRIQLKAQGRVTRVETSGEIAEYGFATATDLLAVNSLEASASESDETSESEVRR